MNLAIQIKEKEQHKNPRKRLEYILVPLQVLFKNMSLISYLLYSLYVMPNNSYTTAVSSGTIAKQWYKISSYRMQLTDTRLDKVMEMTQEIWEWEVKTGQFIYFLFISWSYLYYLMQFVCRGDYHRRNTNIFPLLFESSNSFTSSWPKRFWVLVRASQTLLYRIGKRSISSLPEFFLQLYESLVK